MRLLRLSPCGLFLALAVFLALRPGSAQSGLFVITFAGQSAAGFADGPGAQARFNAPLGIAVDANDNLIVADFRNARVRRIDPAGNVSTIAGGTQGYANGTGPAARFFGPAGVAVDAAGRIIVADYGNHRIRRIDQQGAVTTIAGSGVPGSADGPALSASFSQPTGVAVDGAGNVFVLDSGSHRVRKLDAQGQVTTLAGGVEGYADGEGASAQFDFYGGAPQLCFDTQGNLIVADFYNSRIRRVTLAGSVTTLAGSSTMGLNDGPALTATFFFATGVARDRQGNIIVADWHNAAVRRIDMTARTVATIAGNGNEAHVDGPALTASFIRPAAAAVDSRGNIFITDYFDNCVRRLGAPAPTPQPTPTPRGLPNSSATLRPARSGDTPEPVPPAPIDAILNPSFESGDWGGWSLVTTTINGGPAIVTDEGLVSEGQYALRFSASGRRLADACRQTIELAPGNYTLTCDARSSLGTLATLGVEFGDGTPERSVALAPGASGRLTLNFAVGGASRSATVFFAGNQSQYLRSWVAVDNFRLYRR